MVVYLRKEMKPRELRLAPDELFFDGFNERTVIRNWMSQWLSWIRWYYIVALSDQVTLDDLLVAPVCATSWKRSERIVRFGTMWKLYDMAANWNPSMPPYILGPVAKDSWLPGGFSGSDFIMSPLGLSPMGRNTQDLA